MRNAQHFESAHTRNGMSLRNRKSKAGKGEPNRYEA